MGKQPERAFAGIMGAYGSMGEIDVLQLDEYAIIKKDDAEAVDAESSLSIA